MARFCARSSRVAGATRFWWVGTPTPLAPAQRCPLVTASPCPRRCGLLPHSPRQGSGGPQRCFRKGHAPPPAKSAVAERRYKVVSAERPAPPRLSSSLAAPTGCGSSSARTRSPRRAKPRRGGDNRPCHEMKVKYYCGNVERNKISNERTPNRCVFCCLCDSSRQGLNLGRDFDTSLPQSRVLLTKKRADSFHSPCGRCK